MHEASKTIANNRVAIGKVFSAVPSVPNWCRMCRFVAEYVNIATQLGDAHIFTNMEFRKGIGYLMLPPKRVPSGQILSREEWERVNIYSTDEQRSMADAFADLDHSLVEWAVMHRGDEAVMEGEPHEVRFARGIWSYNQSESGHPRIFKTPLGAAMFRNEPFLRLAHLMPERPLEPKLDKAYLPTMGEEEGYEVKSLKYQSEIAEGVRVMVSDVLSEGRARTRVGRPGEIEQEDEVKRRVRANGNKGLRGFVAQVLRESEWARPDGHPNTEKGRMRCYNRVYSMLKPARRHSKSR